MPPRVQVLLVSEQAAPNLLAALDPELRPQEAVMVVSEKMKSRARHLENVLREAGITTKQIALADEHDFGSIETALLEFACSRDGESIALNVTGGTKVMALAAQSVAKGAGWPVFYVDVDTDQVMWLGGDSHRHPLAKQLRLTHYLKAYGFRIVNEIERPAPKHRHHDLLKTLIGQVGSLEQPLRQLNWLVQQAELQQSLDVSQPGNLGSNPGLNALLRVFEEAGVLRTEPNRVIFSNEAERRFAGGGWLEQYVYRAVTAVTGAADIRDKASNLTILNEDDVKNELDVVVMARNRLFVIECKTARMDRPEAPKANDTLFKLSEVCRRVGGLGTQGMLASYHRLRDSEIKLARSLNISLVCAGDLVQIEDRLKRWFAGR